MKGYKACPICGEETTSIRLQHAKRMSYMGHMKYLPRHHPYRLQKKKKINGKQEHEIPPQPSSREAMYLKMKDMIFSCGKKCWKTMHNEGDNDYGKRKPDFFQLPYWKHLHVRHCLDIMHIEKNVCMNIVGTLLDIPGKSKDGMNTRLDLVEMKIRQELAPMFTGNRTYIPAACYTLSKEENYRFCKTLSEIKVPEGYSANISSRVSLDDLKLTGLKSHDCHVLMQQLLPIAIRSVLPKNVRYTKNPQTVVSPLKSKPIERPNSICKVADCSCRLISSPRSVLPRVIPNCRDPLSSFVPIREVAGSVLQLV